MEDRIDRAKDNPVCRKCGRIMHAADLMTGMTFLEGRVFSCPKCGPLLDDQGRGSRAKN